MGPRARGWWWVIIDEQACLGWYERGTVSVRPRGEQVQVRHESGVERWGAHFGTGDPPVTRRNEERFPGT